MCNYIDAHGRMFYVTWCDPWHIHTQMLRQQVSPSNDSLKGPFKHVCMNMPGVTTRVTLNFAPWLVPLRSGAKFTQALHFWLISENG